MADAYYDEEEVGEEGYYEWEQEEDAEYVEVESLLTEYDDDDFHSGAVNTLDSTIPLNLFEFEYSFGYNCHKYFNLCACDESVVCWAAGSIITFMDVNTKQTWFRRSTTGGSVGCIMSYRKDPNYRIAVAEDREGDRDPLIILYFWPQMEIDAVLRDGTANAYSILDFSPDGDLLASVGKEPDFNLTIWNWKRHKILLRTSAFTFDVNAVMFSPYCPGQLSTAGAAHIKFWKMAETFTGLKLKGELGRFGKTEICDVLGVYPMPDEKVLSGCEWGNVLVWEAGLVKLEVTQRGRKPCHAAPVIQFMLSEAGDEVTTVARDGCVRAWYWDTVDQADPPEDDPYVELNPVAETCVPGCQIMSLKHQKDDFWYAQDGNGGIWVTELDLDKIECVHNKVMNCHAGGIVAMVALRNHHILITAGQDGALMAYNTENFVLLARYTFQTAVTCLLYPSEDVDETSCIILVGFEDGIMRTLLFHPDRLEANEAMIDVRVHSALTIHSEDSVNADVIDLISLLKPHSKSITQITINEQRTLLVTCGADSTIFMYKLVLGMPFNLLRLGFIETPNNIAYMTWKPEEERVLLLCGQVGFIMEAVLPDVDVRKYTDITTFKLEFVSFKETLLKKQYMRHRPFPNEEDLASIDEEALKAQGMADDDEEEEEAWLGEIELMESESMLGTTITWAEYCEEGIWVVQKGTGALFLINPGNNKILKYAPFPGAWCDDITTLKFVCDNSYLIIGTNTGYIRVVRMPYEEEDTPVRHHTVWMTAMTKLLKKLKGRKLAKEEKQPIPRIDFVDNYYLPMHDSYTGAITDIVFNSEGTRLYTCGGDGNIFSYVVNFEEKLIESPRKKQVPVVPKMEKAKEVSTVEGEMMSHEQLKQKEEYDKMMAIANAHKKRVRDQLSTLTLEYSKIIKSNRSLPWSQQIDVTIDPRPLEVQEHELEEAKALTKRKLAHQLEASTIGLNKMYHRNIIQCDVFPFTLRAIMEPEITIRPLRQKNLSPAFFQQLEEVQARMAEAALKGRRADTATRRMGGRKPSWGPPRVHSFLLGLPPKRPHPLKKALRNYRDRLHRHHLQFMEWQEHLSRKPDPNAMPPGAADALKEAEATIGNRLLKTQPDYVAPPGHNTQLRVCLARMEIYDVKHAFNEKVLELRNHKLSLIKRMKSIGERLAEIRVEIPPNMAKPPPPIPVIDEELEFPEKNLEIKPEVITTRTATARGGTGKKAPVPERRATVVPAMRVKQAKVARFQPLAETKPLAASWELIKHRQDMENTPMENEIRERRIVRHLYEQDMLLSDAKVAIEEFDVRLKQLQRERIRVQEKSQLLELHLFQLHREINVLNRFEAQEDRLAERVYAKLMQVRAVQEQITDCEHRIEEHVDTKEALNLACEELQCNFKKLVQDNKFADFLRRIFKKKYRPPRNRDEGDSSESEESSSSSEDEEDEGSVDSRDIGPIRLDPTICPEGCDKAIYDKTYEMRNIRHKHEQDMIEEDHLVELLRKDIDVHNKIKRKLSLQLDKRKNELKEFMLEKQSRLNDVDQVIILRYDQIRAASFRGCTGPEGLSNTVVFPEKMLTKLRKRVLELQDEIAQQKQRQKINRTHLFRMNIDLRAMEAQAEDLRAQMRKTLTRKLGKPRKVDKTLDESLRQMARRHKFSATLGAMPQIRTQLKAWRERHGALEKKYLELLETHSDRLRLTAAIEADLYPIKPPKDQSYMVGGYNPDHYQRDVIRLRIVRAQQMDHIQALTKEIQALRTKPLIALKQPVVKPPQKKRKEPPLVLAFRPKISRQKKRYFPITPVMSTTIMVYDVNVTKLLYDCLDAMRITRDDADALLKEMNDELADVYSGTKSRFEVVDQMLRKWSLKHGGDPSSYKKNTKAFDALATLADRLIKMHMETLEGSSDSEHKMMEALEESLRDLAGSMKEPLRNRLGPALAALIAYTSYEEMLRAGARVGMVKATADTLETEDTTPLSESDKTVLKYFECEETMTALVNSLVNKAHPLSAESIDNIDITHVMDDIRDCGVPGHETVLRRIITKTIKYLRAQLLSDEEETKLIEDVNALQKEVTSGPTSAKRRTTRFDSQSTIQSQAVSKPLEPSPTGADTDSDIELAE